MSTTTFTTVHPPPTFNTLDSFQRARLIRSTRKLGKVLGTTPMLLEPTETCDLRELLPIGPKSYPGSRSNSPSPSLQKSVMYKQSRRHGSLFNIPLGSNFSTTSLASQLSINSVDSATSLRETKGFSSRRTRRAGTPPPLILQVNTVPVAASDPRLPPSKLASPSKTQAPRTPLSASSANVTPLRHRSSSGASSIATPTPLTPSFRFRANAMPEMRRKKMAKVMQQLGENVPPELVFAMHKADKDDVPVIPAVEPRRAPTPLPPPSRPVDSTETAQLRASSLDAVRSPVEASTKEVRQRRRRSMSVGHPIAVQLPSAKSSHRWEAPAEWTLGPVPKGAKKNQKDEEDEEWSAEHYVDVMKQLRALRTRK